MRALAGNPILIDFIRHQIDTHGPVTFKWLMEQALYHPEIGYYAAGRAEVGRGGDFFTNVSVGPIFGQVMARQFVEMWDIMGRPEGFGIVEQGAHHGMFADDVLCWISEFEPDLFEELTYWIIEPSPILRLRQEETLYHWKPKVRWFRDPDNIDDGSLCGVLFSNELLDAYPVHLVTWQGEGWQENYIENAGGRFKFFTDTPSTSGLIKQLKRLPRVGIERYRSEVNMRALSWIETVAKILRRGYVVTIDYGFARDDYYNKDRTTGTLVSHSKQQRIEDPLAAIGHSDISAHVEFTSVVEHGEEAGLTLTGFTDQHHFMVGVLKQLLDWSDGHTGGLKPEVLQGFKTLTHPGLMGMIFKYLVLEKHVDSDRRPAGFAFAGDSRAALGLGPPPKPDW